MKAFSMLFLGSLKEKQIFIPTILKHKIFANFRQNHIWRLMSNVREIMNMKNNKKNWKRNTVLIN